MKFKSELVPPTDPVMVRRVVIELPDTEARKLADVLDNEIVWDTTPVEEALEALYSALYGNYAA